METSKEVTDYAMNFAKGELRLCQRAALDGRTDVIKWLRSGPNPCPWDEWICALAARGGHLETLQWLRAQNHPCCWDEMTCAEAAREGHFEILKWVRAQTPPCPWDYHTYIAAIGRPEIVRWLKENGCPEF